MLKGEIDRAVSYLNIAIELDRRMYKRACKQEIFFPIMDQIRNNKTGYHRYHFTYQELKTKKHLDDTLSLINSLKSEGKKRDNKNDGKIIEIKDIEQREY